MGAGPPSRSADANGNLTVRGTGAFGYDPPNRMKTATISRATSSHTYDGDGKPATKTVRGATTNQVHDANRSLPMVVHAHRQASWPRSAR